MALTLSAHEQKQLGIPAFTPTRILTATMELVSVEGTPEGSWGHTWFYFEGHGDPPITKNLQITSSFQPRIRRVAMIFPGPLPSRLKVNGTNETQLLHLTLLLHTVPPSLSSNCMVLCHVDTRAAVGCRRPTLDWMSSWYQLLAWVWIRPHLVRWTSRILSYKMSQAEKWLHKSVLVLVF